VESGQFWQGAGRQESEVLCPHIVVGPESPRCLLNSSSSLHCVFAFPNQEKGSEKEKKQKEENGSPVGGPATVLIESHAMTSPAIRCYKKLF
jgi:hypothetical protein